MLRRNLYFSVFLVVGCLASDGFAITKPTKTSSGCNQNTMGLACTCEGIHGTTQSGVCNSLSAMCRPGEHCDAQDYQYYCNCTASRIENRPDYNLKLLHHQHKQRVQDRSDDRGTHNDNRNIKNKPNRDAKM